MDRHFALALDFRWAISAGGHEKRLQQNLFDLGVHGRVAEGCQIHLKYRDAERGTRVEETTVVQLKENCFLKSEGLCRRAQELSAEDGTLLLFFEGSPAMLRCIVVPAPAELWESMATVDPPMRPEVYDLPPSTITVIDAEDVYMAVHDLVAGGDAELFGTKAAQFLSSPHIIVPLFAHVLSLSSKDNIDFPLILKTTAEQLRSLLTDPEDGSARIHKIERDHPKLWADVLGERIAFADGGAARIAGLPSLEPLALRVGIYSVIPGESDLARREDWELTPYVMGDIVRRVEGYDRGADVKRLQEAARYILEPLTALRYIARHPDTTCLLLHGPLVNQFAVYNEGEPNFLPVLDPEFLAGYGLNESAIARLLSGVPKSPRGDVLWNQFMAVYGALMKEVFALDVPMAGVVERTAGKWLSEALLLQLVKENRMTEGHAKRITQIIERFDISDDFLFGCVLDDGEYLQPIAVGKNPERRAVPHWAEVVRQYPSPYATVIKTSPTAFPYRVEMNPAAFASADKLLRLLYHTSRLLPRYAFPVGLDIVDKYAKVPDWLSRGVSARITADVLRRALNTGDAKILAQVRQFLARAPRDFFYRPQA